MLRRKGWDDTFFLILGSFSTLVAWLWPLFCSFWGDELQRRRGMGRISASVPNTHPMMPLGRMLTALADVENMRVRMANKAEEDRKFAVSIVHPFTLEACPLGHSKLCSRDHKRCFSETFPLNISGPLVCQEHARSCRCARQGSRGENCPFAYFAQLVDVSSPCCVAQAGLLSTVMSASPLLSPRCRRASLRTRGRPARISSR